MHNDETLDVVIERHFVAIKVKEKIVSINLKKKIQNIFII